MNITKTPLYRALCEGVRKEDHAELARMLRMVDASATRCDFTVTRLCWAFVWSQTPQGRKYWRDLSIALWRAGYECS